MNKGGENIFFNLFLMAYFEQFAKCFNCNNGDAYYVLDEGAELNTGVKCGYCTHTGMVASDQPDTARETYPQLTKDGRDLADTQPSYTWTRYTDLNGG